MRHRPMVNNFTRKFWRMQDNNPLKRLGFIFKSTTGEEFKIIEMNAFKFLSLLEVIFLFEDIDNPGPEEKIELLRNLEIDKKLKIDLFQNREQFDNFYKNFLAIHLPEIPKKEDGDKECLENNKDSFFDNALHILIYATNFINPDMLTLANNYTWRFINKCLNEVIKTSNKKAKKANSTSTGEQVIKREITKAGVKREVVRLN